jgi:hypothetical protein
LVKTIHGISHGAYSPTYVESQSWLVAAEKTARRQLRAAILAFCAHPSQRPEELEELFFQLPKPHRQALEFLATTLCRIDLACTKHGDTVSLGSPCLHFLLWLAASTLLIQA